MGHDAGPLSDRARRLLRARSTLGRFIVYGVVSSVVVVAGIMAIIAVALSWGVRDDRAFVRRHFADVRRGHAAAPPSASRETRDAYRAVAASTGEDLPTFGASNHGFGTPYYDYDTATCFDIELRGNRAASVASAVVRSHTENGKQTFDVHEMSLVHRCNCNHDSHHVLWQCSLE